MEIKDLKLRAAMARQRRSEIEEQLAEKRKAVDAQIEQLETTWIQMNAELLADWNAASQSEKDALAKLEAASLAKFAVDNVKTFNGLQVAELADYKWDSRTIVAELMKANLAHLLKVDETKLKNHLKSFGSHLPAYATKGKKLSFKVLNWDDEKAK